MRIAMFLSALSLCLIAGPGQSQTLDARPRTAVVVVTLDQIRQVQTRHGLSLVEGLGDDRWGRFDLVEPGLTPDVFGSCQDERVGGRLDYCIRYYLTRAALPAEAPPTVVVVFDDSPVAHDGRRSGEMRVACFGRGVTPADAAAQETWLWPDSARLRGVRDWERDRDALADCIAAAASEPWTGLREPDVD